MHEHRKKLANLLTFTTILAAILFAYQDGVLAEPARDHQGLRRYPDDLSRAFRAAAERISPSVVTIQALHGPRCTDEWSRLKGKEPQGTCPSGTTAYSNTSSSSDDDDRLGSGIILDRTGIILTNFHIVEGADAVIVRLANGEEFPAEDVRGDGVSDLAIVRIAGAKRLQAAALGDSGKLQIGDWVTAIGHPFGLDRSISAGIVSATDRKMEHNGSLLIQTDAASNPGNSGGPLINLAGEVVGIVEGASGGASQGVNFAIPINAAKRVVEELTQKGRVIWPVFGADFDPLTPLLAEAIGCRHDETGILITDVAPGMPAERAGLEPGDVITHFSGQRVASTIDFQEAVDKSPVRVARTLRLIRNGRPMTKKIELEPSSMPLPQRPHSAQDELDAAGDQYGLSVSDAIQPSELGYSAHVVGALVTHVRPRSRAYYSGIRAGMIVRRVGDLPIASAGDYEAVSSRCARCDNTVMLIAAPYGSRFIVLKR